MTRKIDSVINRAEIPKDKPLVFYLESKAFAYTIGLINGMNIGVLSKILGHARIQMTLG